jgi:hypothetical protein
MTRETEAALLEFCVAQHHRFDQTSWLAYSHPTPSEMAAVALFLSNVDWYGHQPALRNLADRLQPGCVGSFAELAKSVRFDCGRFSNSLKQALRHAHLAS